MILSKLVSFLFHPILMPTYSFFLLFKFVPMFNLFMNLEQKILIIKVLLLFTILVPLFFVLLILKIKDISSIYMKNYKERKWPILLSLGSYYIAIRILEMMHIHYLIINLLIGAIMILFFAAIISNFWKISLHMMGAGGVVGAFIAIHYFFTYNIFLLVILVLCSGLIGFTRIQENAHNLKQVYTGFLFGGCTEYIVFLL